MAVLIVDGLKLVRARPHGVDGNQVVCDMVVFYPIKVNMLTYKPKKEESEPGIPFYLVYLQRHGFSSKGLPAFAWMHR